MKAYIKPEISVCRFNAEDIITDSAATAQETVTKALQNAGAADIKVVDWNNISVFE